MANIVNFMLHLLHDFESKVIEENVPNLVNDIYKKLTASVVILNGEIWKAFSSILEKNKDGHCHHFCAIVCGSPSLCNKA